MNNDNLLVCADADMPMMAEGSTFDKVCRRCQRRLMIAPSGQRYLAMYPEVETECWACHVRHNPLELGSGEPIAFLLESRRVVPNYRRSRN